MNNGDNLSGGPKKTNYPPRKTNYPQTKQTISGGEIPWGTFSAPMGPYQTLRADTRWTLLQITFRVFFMSNIRKITQTGPQNPGTCLKQKKRDPARHARVVVQIGFHQKSSKSKVSDEIHGPTQMHSPIY